MTDEHCSITWFSIENENAKPPRKVLLSLVVIKVGVGAVYPFLGRLALGSMKTCYGRAARSESDMANQQSLLRNPNNPSALATQ